MKFRNPWTANVFCKSLEAKFKERFNVVICVSYCPEKDRVSWAYPGVDSRTPSSKREQDAWLEGFAAGYGVRK